jgi:hypothetical protein
MDALVSFPLPKKRQNQHKLKKAPGAPRRFKSAFIFFSIQKHCEIRERMGEQSAKAKVCNHMTLELYTILSTSFCTNFLMCTQKTAQTTNVAKLVSEAWKDLTPAERAPFDELARKDKARFEIEKRMYSGPWKVSAEKIRDPEAPKRPCSAFLSFCNHMRDNVKKRFPTASGAEILRELARIWKNSPEREVFIQRELASREHYKVVIAEWRANQRKPDADARQQREDIALKALESQEDGTSTTEVQVPIMRADIDCVTRHSNHANNPANDPAGFSTNLFSNTIVEGFDVEPLSTLNNHNSTNYVVNRACHDHDDFGLNVSHSMGAPLGTHPAGFQKSTHASTPLPNSLAAMMQMSIFSQPTDTYHDPTAVTSRYESLRHYQAEQQWQQQEQLQQLQQEQLQQLYREQLEQLQQEQMGQLQQKQHQCFYQMQPRQFDY